MGLDTEPSTVTMPAANIVAFGALGLAPLAILDREAFADRSPVGQDRRVPVVSR